MFEKNCNKIISIMEIVLFLINLTMNIDQKIKDLNKKLNGSHPKTKIIHPAEPSMQERFNRAWKKVNDEEAAAGETDEGALEGAVKCMMEK